MLAKSVSLVFAAAALVGAVLYAQNKAEKGEKVRPVFESSKSGTPTPWPDDKESPTSPGKKPLNTPPKKQTKNDEKKLQQVEPAQIQADDKEKKPEQKKKKKVMPTSKSLSID